MIENCTPLNSSGSHAIVIGGSMAGMLAARVLVNHFDRVTILERDRLPEGPAPRQGVPQARHLHVLLMRGRFVLESLFPGIENELKAAGALELDAGQDIAWLTPAGWGIRFQSGLSGLTFTRDLLDWIIRRRLTGFRQVQVLDGCEITGLIPADDCSGVAGVSACFHHGTDEQDGVEEPLYADLVVDAGGRGSKTPKWLTAIGYTLPEETVINAHLGYASRLYKIPRGFSADWKAVYIQAAPPKRTRAGVLFPVEGNRWIVSLGGGDRDYPPTDEAGFLGFAQSLPSPILYNAIKDAEPLTPIYSSRSTENRLRHYERLSNLPERFVVTGDAVCAFNPVYGQGMTTAALGALTLDQCLQEQHRRRFEGNLIGFTRRFQQKVVKVNAAPWMLATSEDYRYSGTEGGTPDRLTLLMHRYMDRVLSLSTGNTKVRRLFFEIQNMLKSPAAMFQPGIIARVLWHALRHTLSIRNHHLSRKRIQAV